MSSPFPDIPGEITTASNRHCKAALLPLHSGAAFSASAVAIVAPNRSCLEALPALPPPELEEGIGMIAGQCPSGLLSGLPSCQPPPLVCQGGPAFQRLSIHIEIDPPTLNRPGNGSR